MAELALDRIGSTTPGHYGAEGAGVMLSEATIAAAWNVQGDPEKPAFVNGVAQLFGIPLPLLANTTKRGSALIAFWLGPRSWLLVASSPTTLPGFDSMRDAVNAHGGALFDVSASRIAFRVRGTHAATVLAKSCPLDFHPDVFPVGGCAQSLFGHVNALFYRQDAMPTFAMLVARSFARDVWRLLGRSSAQYGYDVTAAQPLASIR